eukprot:SAG25_NODE_13488_length_266_cov_0.910180_1_plen_55_part_01
MQSRRLAGEECVADLTLRHGTRPRIGMLASQSHAASVCCRNPVPSLPSTTPMCSA